MHREILNFRILQKFPFHSLFCKYKTINSHFTWNWTPKNDYIKHFLIPHLSQNPNSNINQKFPIRAINRSPKASCIISTQKKKKKKIKCQNDVSPYHLLRWEEKRKDKKKTTFFIISLVLSFWLLFFYSNQHHHLTTDRKYFIPTIFPSDQKTEKVKGNHFYYLDLQYCHF